MDFGMLAVVAVVGLVLIPILTGWIHGRNQMDPDTPEGKKYYEED